MSRSQSLGRQSSHRWALGPQKLGSLGLAPRRLGRCWMELAPQTMEPALALKIQGSRLKGRRQLERLGQQSRRRWTSRWW
jgi:hypothetical protein